jgi:hypothetical protein
MTLNKPLDNTEIDDNLENYFINYLDYTTDKFLYNKLLDNLWRDLHTELNNNLRFQIYGELL